MNGLLVKIVDLRPGVFLLLDIADRRSNTLLVLLLQEVGEGNDEADVESMSEVIMVSDRRFIVTRSKK